MSAAIILAAAALAWAVVTLGWFALELVISFRLLRVLRRAGDHDVRLSHAISTAWSIAIRWPLFVLEALRGR